MTWTAAPTQGAWLYDLGPIDYLPDPPLQSVLPPITIAGELDYYVTGDTLEDFAVKPYGDIRNSTWDAYIYWDDQAGTISERSALIGDPGPTAPWRLILALYPPDFSVDPGDTEPPVDPLSLAPTGPPPPVPTEPDTWYRSWTNNGWVGLVGTESRRLPPSPGGAVMPPFEQFTRMEYLLTSQTLAQVVERYDGDDYLAGSYYNLSNEQLFSYRRNVTPTTTTLPQSVMVMLRRDQDPPWYDVAPTQSPTELYSLAAGTTLDFEVYEDGSNNTREIALISAHHPIATLQLAGWRFPLTIRDPDLPVYSFERWLQLTFSGQYTAVRNGRMWATNLALNPGWDLRWGYTRGYRAPTATPSAIARHPVAAADPGVGELLAGPKGLGLFDGDNQDEWIVLQASVRGSMGAMQPEPLRLVMAWDEI